MGIFDPFDWNGNGTHDIFDDMMDFFIFQEVMKDQNEDDTDFNDEDTEEYGY